MLSEIVRGGQISYVFNHTWMLRNLTEDQGGREGGKKQLQTEREGGTPQETLKSREQTGGG